MLIPEIVTVTGADDHTLRTEGLRRLADLLRLEGAPRGRVEIGILLSGSRQGGSRYPRMHAACELMHIAHRLGFRVSFHLCGSFARRAFAGTLSRGLAFVQGADRVQVNGKAEPHLEHLAKLFQRTELPPAIVLQSRGPEFPSDRRFDWLADRSGGAGKLPDSWPRHEPHCGYAGGLSPENVREELAKMGAVQGMSWIDAESGLRKGVDFSPERAALFVARALEVRP